MKIYVASSWKNQHQPDVVSKLRIKGHDVYDYRNPCPGNDGFAWHKTGIPGDPETEWTMTDYSQAMKSKAAIIGYSLDHSAICACHVGVLVLPSGNDAHLEAGLIIGQGKPLFIFAPNMIKPGLMYAACTALCRTMDQLVFELGGSHQTGNTMGWRTE